MSKAIEKLQAAQKHAMATAPANWPVTAMAYLVSWFNGGCRGLWSTCAPLTS